MRTTKIGLAALLALTLALGLAAPAAASSPGEVESGTWDTALGSIDLTPGSQGPPPCPEKPSTLVWSTAANPNIWTLTGGWSFQFQFPAASGIWYQIDFTVLAGNGNWAGTAPTQGLTGSIVLRADYFFIGGGGNPNCMKTVLVCRVTTTQVLQAPASTYKGHPGLPTTSVGDLVTLTTTGTIIATNCPPPFNAMGGASGGFTNLQIVLI
jgi:hypothetical protein